MNQTTLKNDLKMLNNALIETYRQIPIFRKNQISDNKQIEQLAERYYCPYAIGGRDLTIEDYRIKIDDLLDSKMTDQPKILFGVFSETNINLYVSHKDLFGH